MVWTGVPILLRADLQNVGRFSDQSDIEEKATVLVNKLGKVREE